MGLFGKDKEELDAVEQQKQLVILYKQVFLTEQGKKVLCDLMNRHNMLAIHELTPFEQGKRSVVSELLQLCNVKPEQFQEFLEGEIE